jgi:hypothetical protein
MFKSAALLLLLALAVPPLVHAAPIDSTKTYKAYQKHLRQQAKKTQKAQEKQQKQMKKLHPTSH